MKTEPGSWPSPISADKVVDRTVFLGELTLAGTEPFWTETDPKSGGRTAVLRHGKRMTPPEFDIRSRVHEYGGGSFTATTDRIFFVRADDQQLYRQNGADSPPVRLTSDAGTRYADGAFDPVRGALICVREDHRGAGEAVNTLVSVDAETGRTRVLSAGHDFYSSPRLSPDGRRLAFLTWNHPDMPWHGTELLIARLAEDGSLAENPRVVAGGRSESVFQPEWSPDGRLHFVSDRTGWWNLYRCDGDEVVPLYPSEADFGLPQWAFGLSTYAFASDDRIICSYLSDGVARLAALDVTAGSAVTCDLPYTALRSVRATAQHAYFIGGGADRPEAIVELDLATGTTTELRVAAELTVDPGYVSTPRPLWFPSEGGQRVHAFFYPPANAEHRLPDGVLPPLLVMSHGGPTAAATPTLRWTIQYWTSRGIAVLDVNYRGSSGFGRAYRDRLDGAWGVADVADCVHGAQFLAREGHVDPGRLAITGASAGGYTALCALAFHSVFHAGASHFGVSDLAGLWAHTHKFESHYLTRLIGPYPGAEQRYRERSPLAHADRLSAPVIFFQGLDDEVVPPEQTERMVDALRERGIPVAYLPFPGERHGFLDAANIKRAIEAELFFYARIFGFTPADPPPDVDITGIARA
jgi:dipeptidyl aminopeptidase/acylaminoacyl peptidase